MIRKYRYLLTAAAAVGAAGLLTFAARNDFGLGRNMEIAVNMMRELSLNYVDPVDPDRLMEGAAAGMVSDLDPYTEYIPEEGMQDFELLTTGKYGGIGALIRQKDDYVRIAQPYQGSPADKAGLKIGDKILSIDGKDAKGFTTEQVSSRLKGEPGSKVKVTVEHLDGTQQTAAIRRERIAIPGVPYAGWVADGIGYIRHSDFTEGCYEEMRAAIERLRTERPLKGLVLDYRSNGGGIMQEAVKILGMFVPKGTEVVSTKGRSEDSKQVFRTDTEPILADLPLTVLINGNSASAAEIVAGALQDLDRAVLIGQRSFGKGLVQSPRPLGYNAMLKLTTAKYYIPSGRCIQAIDYSHSQEGSVRAVPDSLISEFTTRAGRKVYDGGGVMPDIAHRPGVHFTLRPDALRAGIHRGFRRRIHAPQPRPADRHPHLLDHGQGLRRLRGVHARQEGPLRIGHPPGAQGAEKSRRGRPFRRLEEQVRAGGGRVEGRHADQPRNLPHAGRRDDQQRHRHAPRLPGRRDRALAVGRQGGEKGRRGARRSRRVRPNHPRAGHQAQVKT